MEATATAISTLRLTQQLPCSATFSPSIPFLLAKRGLFSGVSLFSTPNLRTLHSPTRAVERSDQGSFGGRKRDKALILPNLSNFTKTLIDFAVSNFLPIALISAVTVGMTNPALGCHAHKYQLSKFCTFGIFFIAGLKLQGKEIGAVAEAWPAGIFGLASILLLGPFLSMLILQVQLAPQEFITGLAIFCCMPTTLSSGVALTQLVSGNSALALAMTVATNLLGILTVPFWISRFLSDGFGVSIPTGRLCRSLIFTLLFPLVLGKVVRNSVQGLATYVDKNYRVLSMTSVILLSLTPWIEVSKSRSLLLMVKPQAFIEAIVMGIVIHLTLLGFNTIAVQALSAQFGGGESIFAKKENSRTLLIVCSQKALLVAVTVLEPLSGALGQSGMLVLPCVAAHINQIIIDSLLVNFWLQKDGSQNKIRKI